MTDILIPLAILIVCCLIALIAFATWRSSRGRPMELIVMRLADMTRVHPDQIVGKCAGCGHDVGIYPSGQAIMRQHKSIRLTCQVCKTPGPNAPLAPGAEFEPFQSVTKKP